MSRKVVVFWLERARDGTAAGAHLRGTLSRLDALEARVVRVIADRTSADGGESYRRKAARLASLVIRGVAAARRHRTLVARYHPLMLPVVLAWRGVGGKVVLSVQGALDAVGGNQYPWLKGSRIFKLIAVLPARFANGLIVGAPTIEEHVREEMLGSNAALVSIPNGIFVEELRASRRTSRPIEEPYVVFVGNLATWQGIETLVAALEDSAWPKGLRLVVVGDGVEREAVVRAAGADWKGQLPSGEAHRWLAHALCAFSLQRSDVEVSEHGYWPFKLIESAAAGTPMVCSDAAGLPEAAAKLGHAIVVPAQDSSATAGAVAMLASDVERRETLSAVGMRAAQEFDWRVGSRALQQMFDAVDG